MTAMSGATVPAGLQAKIDEAGSDEEVRAIGVQHCNRAMRRAPRAGVPGLHFYTFKPGARTDRDLAALRRPAACLAS